MHWTAAKRLLRYLKQTIYHGIHIRKNLNSVLTTYTNVDWAGNYDNRSSTSTCICFLGPHLISWSSRKQRATARSSMEAEYRALSRAGSETIWLLSLCQELGLPICSPPTLLLISATFSHETHSN
ncbi:hypothetical protein Peur_067706 [Populus x canadensis]